MAIVATTLSQVALRNPRCGPMGARRELGEGVFRLAEHPFGFVEPPLIEKRPAKDQPCVPDFVEAILPPVQPPERVTRVLLGCDRIAGPQIHLGKRRDSRRHIVVVAVLERDRDRLLKAGDRLLGMPEQ